VVAVDLTLRQRAQRARSAAHHTQALALMRARQALREAMPQRARGELEAFLPVWAKAYARLVTDSDRRAAEAAPATWPCCLCGRLR